MPMPQSKYFLRFVWFVVGTIVGTGVTTAFALHFMDEAKARVEKQVADNTKAQTDACMAVIQEANKQKK